jgi:hypothetical protein
VPGQPKPDITWQTVAGGALPSGYDVIDGNTLRNSRVKRGDGGNFMCTAKNIAGSRSSTVEIIASGNSEFGILNKLHLQIQ